MVSVAHEWKKSVTRVPQSNATGIPPDMPPIAPESPCIIPSWCAWSIARTLTEAPSQGRASMLWRGTRLPAGIITRYGRFLMTCKFL